MRQSAIFLYSIWTVLTAQAGWAATFTVDDFGVTAVSYPGFARDVAALGGVA